MKFVQMEHFIAVVEEKNYSNAAKRCYISRQAVSNSIQSLSKELNMALIQLDRNNQPIVTENGWEVYHRIKHIMNEVDELVKYAESISSGDGNIRIAFSDTLAPMLERDLLKKLYQLKDDSGYHIAEIAQVNNDTLASGTYSGYDLIIFIGDSTKYSSMPKEILSHIPMMLTIPYTNELYKKEEIHISDLAGQTVIFPVTLDSFHLLDISNKYQIKFEPITNIYSAGHKAIEKGYCILDAEYKEYDCDFIQRKILDFSYKWDIIGLWSKGGKEPIIQKILQTIRNI